MIIEVQKCKRPPMAKALSYPEHVRYLILQLPASTNNRRSAMHIGRQACYCALNQGNRELNVMEVCQLDGYSSR